MVWIPYILSPVKELPVEFFMVLYKKADTGPIFFSWNMKSHLHNNCFETLNGWISHLWLIQQLKVTGTHRTSREAVKMFGTGAKPHIPCDLHCAPLPDLVQWPSCPDPFTFPKVGWTPGFPGSVQSHCLWEGKEQWDVNMWTQHEVATTLKVAAEVWGTEGGWTGHQEQHRAATHYRNSTNDEAPLTGALLLFRNRRQTQPGTGQ